LDNLDLDEKYMRRAIALAAEAGKLGEVPVGALIVHENQIISESYNERETRPSALAHAELTAIGAACRRLGRWRLSECTLYVTLEPCVMCAGAIVQSRLDRVVFGATDAKGGGVISLYKILEDPRLNHRPAVTGGMLADECARLLSDFFKHRRSATRNVAK
jgi:tRNA(adenine34) deaminase